MVNNTVGKGKIAVGKGKDAIYHCFQTAFPVEASKVVTISCVSGSILNSLQNDKISDQSKFKAFADDKINLTQKLKFVKGREENIVGKGENAGYQHFLLFPQCFHQFSSSGSLKVGIVW